MERNGDEARPSGNFFEGGHGQHQFKDGQADKENMRNIENAVMPAEYQVTATTTRESETRGTTTNQLILLPE
jgi:hypothetical protein